VCGALLERTESMSVEVRAQGEGSAVG
jgi:hypothetical protein